MAQREGAHQLEKSPIATFICPSRRQAIAYPWDPLLPSVWRPRNAIFVPGDSDTAHTDYAANAGDGFIDQGARNVLIEFYMTSSECGKSPGWAEFWGPAPAASKYDNVDKFCWPPEDSQNGVCFLGAEIRLLEITDGTSNTIFVGEKYVNPDEYETGTDPGDNLSMYSGWDWNVNRFAGVKRSDPSEPSPFLPGQDQIGLQNFKSWGSAHPGSFHVAMCDGSSTSISYDIDPVALGNLCNRFDGLVVEASN